MVNEDVSYFISDIVQKWQVKVKVPFHLRFLTRFDKRILSQFSEIYNHNLFLQCSFPKFESLEHE